MHNLSKFNLQKEITFINKAGKLITKTIQEIIDELAEESKHFNERYFKNIITDSVIFMYEKKRGLNQLKEEEV